MAPRISTLSLVVSINYGFTAALLVGIAAYATAGASGVRTACSWKSWCKTLSRG